MDDYFAEADEHIAGVRRSLLALEAAIGSAPPAAVLEELFRNCHSLKGISAMVDLHEAEVLAHQMESCLRAVRHGGQELDGVAIETLLAATNVLEEVVVARRAGKPLPPIEPIIKILQARAATAPGGPRATSPDRVGAGAPARGVRLWKVKFAPSPQLIERGIKVDTVRSRLLQIGKIHSVAPKVLPGGGISFVFDLQTDDEKSLASWVGDGITYESLGEADPAVAAALETAGTELPVSGTRSWELASGAATNVVRVDLARLDDLMRLVGDLVVTRARLDDLLGRIEPFVPSQEFRALQEHDGQMERQLRDLREGIMRVRMVPVGEIFRRMPYVVRDLARDNGKRVKLEIAGQSTEIDKFLIERMMDPVLHLVRNAISHGIETPEARVAAGKPAEGTIRLSASTAGEFVVIEVADDGAGIDALAIAERAAGRGVPTGDGPPDSRVLLDIICSSGFSTRDEADRASGRGVGMTVVRSAVQELGGTLGVDTAPGRGTTFTIELPLTLAIIDAIITTVGDQTFAVPQSTIREVIEVDGSALRAMENNELLTYRGRALPVLRIARIFQLRAADRPRFHAIVVGTGSASVGLLVDRITGHREIVVKPITDPLIRVRGVSGATQLGDGRLILILDVAALAMMPGDRPRPNEKVLA